MTNTLHIHKSLPWLALGLGAGVVVFAVGAIIAESSGEPIDGGGAAAIWLLIAVAAGITLKGLLVVFEDLSVGQALAAAGLALLVAFVAVILHNVVSGLFGFEEGFFFVIALLGAPLLLIAAVVQAIRASTRD